MEVLLDYLLRMRATGILVLRGEGFIEWALRDVKIMRLLEGVRS